MARKAKDLIGQVFGRLTVAKREGSDKGGSAMWRCNCSCGGNKVVRAYSLKRGDTTSCGCIKKENAWDKFRVHGDDESAAYAYYWGQYKRNAKHRGIEITITQDDHKEISSLPCFYCGLEPEERPTNRGRTSIKASGIDRIDNSKGYTKENSVPCCSWCNVAKRHHTVEEFMENCIRVANAAIARN